MKKEQQLSNEITHCGKPTIVHWPETLECQKCGKKWMNLVQGVNPKKVLPTKEKKKKEFEDNINF